MQNKAIVRSSEFLRKLTFLSHCVFDENTRNHFMRQNSETDSSEFTSHEKKVKVLLRQKTWRWGGMRQLHETMQTNPFLDSLLMSLVSVVSLGYICLLLFPVCFVKLFLLREQGSRKQKTSGCYSSEYLKVTEFFPSTSNELLTDLELRIPTLFPTYISLSFPENSFLSSF